MAVTFRWKRPAAWSDGRRVFPDFRQLRMQLRASWVNKRWISAEELEEIRRGN